MNYDARIDAPAEADRDVDADVLAAVHPLHQVDAEERRLRRRNLIYAAIAAALLLALWFALHRSKPAELDAAAANQAPVVTVVMPGRSTVVGTINATGTLAARHELPVGSVGDGGAVSQVLVDAGQWLRKGQVLAVIDRSVQVEQQASQASQIGAAQADARLAQANLDRALKLVERGFISKADLDRLTATRDGADSRVRIARAQLGEVNARIRRLYITAPDAGLLLERAVEPGQVVGPGSGVLFRIAKGGELELRAKLGESDLAQLAVGQAAVVTPVGTTSRFTGQIWQLSPTIDLQSRQGMARIALPYAPQLRPGGFAGAEIRSGTVLAPILPESALQADAQGSYVYVVGRNNRAERRAVKLGLAGADGVAILDGLSGNERVVMRAGAFLSAGETINPKIAPSSLPAPAASPVPAG